MPPHLFAAPEQLALDVLRAAGVVLPVGQGSQAAVGDDAFPPADQLPALHSPHPALPNPGTLQGAGSGRCGKSGVGLRWESCACWCNEAVDVSTSGKKRSLAAI